MMKHKFSIRLTCEETQGQKGKFSNGLHSLDPPVQILTDRIRHTTYTSSNHPHCLHIPERGSTQMDSSQEQLLHQTDS